jgi:hypothetical protein
MGQKRSTSKQAKAANMANIETPSTTANEDKKLTYRFLQSNQIDMIDEALASLGEFGEVRLVVEKGRLRFLVTQRSFDTLKWHPGSLHNGCGHR